MLRGSLGTLTALACAAAVLVAGAASSAVAMEAAAPDFMIVGGLTPSVLRPGSEGYISLYTENIGPVSANAGARVVDVLPEGLTAIAAKSDRGECEVVDPTHVSCTMRLLHPLVGLTNVRIRVKAATRPSGGAVDDVATISGGGAPEPATATIPVSVGESAPRPGFNDFSAWLANADGMPDTQAGSHPYDLEVGFTFNTETTVPLEDLSSSMTAFEQAAGGQVRTVNVNLPPGLVADAQAVPRCPRMDFDRGFTGECPLATQVGVNESVTQGVGPVTEPVYNLEPPAGVAAQFAFNISGIPVFLDGGVRTGGDNGVTSHAANLPRRYITANLTTIWGVPASPAHNFERCVGLIDPYEDPLLPQCEDHEPPVPLLTLPSSCGAPLEFTAELLGTYEEASVTAPLARAFTRNGAGDAIGLTECERLRPFDPAISIAPDTTYADTPAGLSVDVSIPQGLNQEGLSTPNLKDTKVVLPEGVVINPGQATGLQACKPSQEALGTEPDGEVNEKPPSCPAASKVGTVEIETPLLRNTLTGSVYILQKNPPSLELMIAASADGVNLKLVGQVHLNEQTGQLTTTFDETPDTPFTNFRLSFSGGARAALATPTRCGIYESTADFTPWSTPYIGNALDTSRFQIGSGPNGAACPYPMPFAPSMTAGATTDQAGGYTAFTMLIKRQDEQQRIGTLSFKTPPGLLGMISQVQLCREPQAASGNCPAGSEIGHAVATSGPGPYPFEVPQAGRPPAPIYITGPYDGAPYGLSIKVPVVAGPFNLGTVIVRAKIEVDPHTSQLTITTTDLPRILDGIPTDIREVDAVIDRPRFMFNPTDCNVSAFTGTATSLEGASAPLSSRFQVGSCRSLSFNPSFTAVTSAKHTHRFGDGLTVKVGYPTSMEPGQATSEANIAKVKVELPKKLPSELRTLQKACAEKQFAANPAGCPAESVVGTAVVHTPVLPGELQGPAYFVSRGGAKFPELIVVLQGENGITVQLNGETFISSKGITSSTFNAVPDVPFSSFELTLPAGPHSALAANGNLCRKALEMPTTLTAQNGAVIEQNTRIEVTGCKAAHRKKRHRRRKQGATASTGPAKSPAHKQ